MTPKSPNHSWTDTSDNETIFPWNPEEGIMPKRPKVKGNAKRPVRPRRMPRRR